MQSRYKRTSALVARSVAGFLFAPVAALIIDPIEAVYNLYKDKKEDRGPFQQPSASKRNNYSAVGGFLFTAGFIGALFTPLPGTLPLYLILTAGFTAPYVGRFLGASVGAGVDRHQTSKMLKGYKADTSTDKRIIKHATSTCGIVKRIVSTTLFGQADVPVNNFLKHASENRRQKSTRVSPVSPVKRNNTRPPNENDNTIRHTIRHTPSSPHIV